MASYYYDSAVGKTSGLATTQVTGLGDKRLTRANFFVKMTAAGTAGLLYFVARWNDRDGTAQTHISAGLSIASAGRIQDSFNLWTEDASGQGAAFEYEIQVVGILGGGTYEYWFTIDDLDQGV